MLTSPRPSPPRAPGAAPLLAALLAVACGPGKDTSATDAASTGTTGASTDAGTTDGVTTQPTSSTGPTTEPTTEPTSTTGAPLGCNGRDAVTCGRSIPLGDDNQCVWVDIYTATIGGTVCRTAPARATCMEANTNEGGPGCSGFFQVGPTGVELLVDTGCGTPITEPAWEFCFVDGVTPAIPECACIGEGYCGDQPDEATCMMASHDLRACAWQQDACGPA
jgi:hypothetical protein